MEKIAALCSTYKELKGSDYAIIKVGLDPRPITVRKKDVITYDHGSHIIGVEEMPSHPGEGTMIGAIFDVQKKGRAFRAIPIDSLVKNYKEVI